MGEMVLTSISLRSTDGSRLEDHASMGTWKYDNNGFDYFSHENAMVTK